MRDQQINSFNKGMAKDLGTTVPQDGFYIGSKNIRIITDGESEQSAIVTTVKGNKKKLMLKHTIVTEEWRQQGEGANSILVLVTTEHETPVYIIGYTYIRETLVVFGVVHAASTPTGFNDISVIYKLDINTYVPELVLESTELNFDVNYPIEAIGRYESANIQRIYFTDSLNPVRTLNIQNDYSDLEDITELNLSPIAVFEKLNVEEVSTGGNLPAGMYQYAYRLKTSDGAVTRFSQLSNFVHIINGTQYWEYIDDPENQTEANGTALGEETNKKVYIKIEDIDPKYDAVELVAVYRTTSVGQTSIQIVDEVTINTNRVAELTHSTNENAIPISVEELTAFNQSAATVKTIAEKDNRLFLGNVKVNASDLTFNARSYRYKRQDDILFPYKSTSDVETYTSYNNPYNHDQEWFSEQNNLYKYQDNGATLGGTGEYIDFKFTKIKLPNSAKANIPAEAPFLGANLIDDYKGSVTAGKYRGYQRDEVYRFGIVLYDKVGNPGFVNWIADIRFPAVDDVDKEGVEGMYTYAISSTDLGGSGTTLCQNYDDPNHQDMTIVASNQNVNGTFNGYPNYLNGIVSNHSSGSQAQSGTDAGTSAQGNLYALGVEFKLKDLPESIKENVGGYSFVRVKRQDVDKSTVAVGALTNYFHYYDNSTLNNTEQPYYFSANRNLSYANTTTQNYTEDNESISYPYQRYINVSSPEFDFTDNYISLNEVNTNDRQYRIRILGGLWSQFKSDIDDGNTDDSSHTYGVVCGAHIVNPLRITYNTEVFQTDITYGAKHNVGGSVGEDLESLIAQSVEGVGQGVSADAETGSFYGFWNIVTDTGIDGTVIERRKISVGEKAQFFRTEQKLDWAKFLSTKNELYGENYSGNEFDKLLVAVKRNNVADSRYGGADESAIASSKYISTGHFNKYNPNSNAYEQVFGGDTYVAMYDITRMRKTNAGVHGDSAFPADVSSQYEAMGLAFPVETSFNITLRQGWHFANQPDFSGDTLTPLNQFILNATYSSENDTFTYIAPPLFTNYVSEYSSRIMFSDIKVDNAVSDGWRNISPGNYRDIDGNYGDINKLIVYNDQMYYLQDNAFGALKINPVSTVVDATGTNITLGIGSKVIQDHQNVSTYTGCKDNRHVIAGQTGIYWIDVSTKKAYHFNKKGLNPISDTKLIKSYEGLAELDSNSKVCLGYDYINNEILYSLDSSGETLIFNELTNSFSSTYTFTTDLFMSLPNRLYSVPYFEEGYIDEDESRFGIYLHNEGNIAEWYEISYPSEIEFVVNKHPLYTKVFDNLEWYSKGGTADDVGIIEFQDSQNTRSVAIDESISVAEEDQFFYKEVKEKMVKLPVPRTQAGYRFRDTYVKIKLIATNAKELTLHYVKTLFRISRR
jgi:hypothetical protein